MEYSPNVYLEAEVKSDNAAYYQLYVFGNGSSELLSIKDKETLDTVIEILDNKTQEEIQTALELDFTPEDYQIFIHKDGKLYHTHDIKEPNVFKKIERLSSEELSEFHNNFKK